jgi:hypothetical protein
MLLEGISRLLLHQSAAAAHSVPQLVSPASTTFFVTYSHSHSHTEESETKNKEFVTQM